VLPIGNVRSVAPTHNLGTQSPPIRAIEPQDLENISVPIVDVCVIDLVHLATPRRYRPNVLVVCRSNGCRVSPALNAPGGVLRLDAVQTALSLCVLAR
jgi:hypothetical protein